MHLEILHYYDQCTGLFGTEFMPWSSLLKCSVNYPIKNWYLEWRTQLTSITVHHSNKWQTFVTMVMNSDALSHWLHSTESLLSTSFLLWQSEYSVPFMDGTADNSPHLHPTLSQAIHNPPANFLKIHFSVNTVTSTRCCMHLSPHL
jgi:hypothetical protein